MSHRTTTTVTEQKQRQNPHLTDISPAAQDWWDEHCILDELNHRELLGDHETVLQIADGLGIDNVHDLMRQARTVLQVVSGGKTLNIPHPNVDLDVLHRTRNAIATIALTSDVLMADTPDPYPLLTRLPHITPLPGSKRRPMTDAEIFLARCGATFDSTLSNRYQRRALQYALAEAGALPTETTLVTPREFDDPRNPTTVALPGVHGRDSRVVTLGLWARQVLARGIDSQLGLSMKNAMDDELCFTGRSPKARSASSSNNIKHCLERVGINNPSLEGSAPTRWRVQNELRTAGEVAALKLLGQFRVMDIRVERVYAFLDQAEPTVLTMPEPLQRRSFKGL